MTLPALGTGSEYVPSAAINTATLSTASIAWTNGDVVIVKLATWDTNATMNAPTGGSQTYTQRVLNSPGANRAWVAIYSATISGSPGSFVVSSVHAGTASWHTMMVERWTGAQLAASPVVASGGNTSSVPSMSLTTSANDSIISCVNSDWNARDPSSRTYVGTTTEEGVLDKSGSSDVVEYHWYQSVATAGAQSPGISAPLAQNWTAGAIEVLAAGGAQAPAPAIRVMRQAVKRSYFY
jgi:hypothetical protein